MSLVINHNLMAMNAARNLGEIYARLSTSTQRLSSGLRVNSAMDDAAGLAIRELMRADILVINQGIRNAADAISMIQTAEGGLNVIDEKLVRMKELAEQAATGTYTTAQREIMDSEYQAMAAEIDRIANATEFNGVKLLDGTLSRFHDGSGLKVHFGVGNSKSEDYYFINMGDMRAREATGLRVGNADLREVWRTTDLNALSATDIMNQSQPSYGDGLFGIQYSTTLDGSNNPVWEHFGYVNVDANQDSISSLSERISAGSQARGTITFTTASLSGQSITLNEQVYTFSSASTTNSYSYSDIPGASRGTVGIGSWGSLSTIAAQFAGMLNSNMSSTGIIAVVNGTTVHLFSEEFGAVGNEVGMGGSTAGISYSGVRLSGGGEKMMSAGSWYDNARGEYELEISMDIGGDANQIRLFTLSSTGGPVIEGFGATVGFYSNVFTGVGAGGFILANNYEGTDEDAEWIEAQNGSGRTDWDGRDIRTQSAAQTSLSQLDDAINRKDIRRAELGAFANRLDNTITALRTQAENLQAAESRISDVDVALEMTEFTRNNILAQAAVAMLAQANALPQLALTLLG